MPLTPSAFWGTPGVDFPLGKVLGPCLKANWCAGVCPNSLYWPSVRITLALPKYGITGGPYTLTPAADNPDGIGRIGPPPSCDRPAGRFCCVCDCSYSLKQYDLPDDPDTQPCVSLYPTCADFPKVNAPGCDGGSNEGRILLPEGIQVLALPGGALPGTNGCNPLGGGAENTARTTSQLSVVLAITGYKPGAALPCLDQISYAGVPIGPNDMLLGGPLDCDTFTCACPHPLHAKFTPLYSLPSFPGEDPIDPDGYILVETDVPDPGTDCPDTNPCPEISQGDLLNTSERTGGHRAVAPARPPGVGGHVSKILQGLGQPHTKGCGCANAAAVMDRWGPAGVRRQRRYWENYLRDELAKLSAREKVAAGMRGLSRGIILNPKDPVPGILNRAIERAERGVP